MSAVQDYAAVMADIQELETHSNKSSFSSADMKKFIKIQNKFTNAALELQK